MIDWRRRMQKRRDDKVANHELFCVNKYKEERVEHWNARTKKSVLFLASEGFKDVREVQGFETWIQNDVSTPHREKKKWNNSLHLPSSRFFSHNRCLYTQKHGEEKMETLLTFLMKNICLMRSFSEFETETLPTINGCVSSGTYRSAVLVKRKC